MTTPPRIVCAAMLMDDGHIVTGVRHYSPDMRATLRRMYGMGFKLFGKWVKRPYHLRVVEQGFINTRCQFLTREEAWKAAEANGQIREITGSPGTLYSEDLY